MYYAVLDMNETIFGTRFVYGLSRADYIMNPNRLSALTIQLRKYLCRGTVLHYTPVCIVSDESRRERKGRPARSRTSIRYYYYIVVMHRLYIIKRQTAAAGMTMGKI